MILLVFKVFAVRFFCRFIVFFVLIEKVCRISLLIVRYRVADHDFPGRRSKVFLGFGFLIFADLF